MQKGAKRTECDRYVICDENLCEVIMDDGGCYGHNLHAGLSPDDCVETVKDIVLLSDDDEMDVYIYKVTFVEKRKIKGPCNVA